MNRRILFLLVAASLFPVAAHALGIGRLHLESALNEPFEARIELLSPTREELDSLNVALADSEAFARAGIDRPFILSQLRFEVVESEQGADYIRVSSREPIREPFLNFLVEVSWSRGRLFREYTVLLDPPLYDPGARSIAASPEPARGAAAPLASGTGDAGYTDSAVTPRYTGTEYGPTVETDTLWSIASAVRPDAGVSIQQMMLALVRANPEAFIEGNVNGLRKGVILRIPDRDEVASVSAEAALAEVAAQHAAWQGVREAAASTAAARPDTSTGSAGTPAAPAATVAEESPELRLVAPGGNGSGDAAPGAGSGNQAALRDLALAQEQLQALSQENVDLKERLAETEAIVEDLKRLIALKDDELAALQRQTAGGALPAEPAAAPAEEAPAEEEAPAGKEAAAEEASAGEEPAAEAEAAPAPKEPEKKPKAEKKAAPPPPPPPPPPEPTLVEKVTGFVSENLPLVGGSVLAVILLAGGLAFAARRRRAAAEEAFDTGEFGDFGTAPETDLSPEAADDGSEDITNVREDLDEEPSGDGDATAVAPSARPAAQPAPQSQSAPAASEPEEDPLAEVNVFLAYEHFDQAEEFVRDAIAREPDNLDFHAKLLEVFYASGDKRKYEEAARVLHDKVGGSGPHWDSAVAMWNEMSPGRALFAAPVEGEEEAGPARGGAGVLDLTAAAGQNASMGLDFDLGEATAEPAVQAPAQDEGILDLTAGNEEATAPSPSPADEDILDVTAAVGLDTEPAAEEAASDDDDVLDITGGREAAASGDVLDISSSGTDNLLDVTAHSNVSDGELDGDPLDVTATMRPGAGSDEPVEPPAPAADDGHTLDFNLDLPAPGEPASDDNVIDFEPAGASGASEDGGLELDLSADDGAAEPPQSEDGGLELDVGGDDDASGLELSLDDAGEEQPEQPAADGGLEFDLSLTPDEEEPASGGLELEIDAGDVSADEPGMDGTVEIPKLELELEDDDDDDDARTVFVPRSGDAEEQSAEDEMATKLDLAKAYVELGDKESAKSILDEVIAGGTDRQREKARELISQIS